MGIVEGEIIGDWHLFQKIMASMRKDVEKISLQALRAMAMWYAGQVKKGIVSQAPGGMPFAPLAESTKAKKKGSKILIEDGDLKMGVVGVMSGPKEAFVGLLRARTHTATGKSLANLAKIHEEGAPNANIPARPFLWPIWKSSTKRREARRVAMNVFLRQLKKRTRR